MNRDWNYIFQPNAKIKWDYDERCGRRIHPSSIRESVCTSDPRPLKVRSDSDTHARRYVTVHGCDRCGAVSACLAGREADLGLSVEQHLGNVRMFLLRYRPEPMRMEKTNARTNEITRM